MRFSTHLTAWVLAAGVAGARLGLGCSLSDLTAGRSGGDGAAEATLSDASPFASDSADQTAPDAPSVPWCSTEAGAGHIFCADFDEGTVTAGWDPFDGGALPILDTTAWTSPPASVQFLARPSPGMLEFTLLRKQFLQQPSFFLLEFDVRVDESPANAIALAGFSFASGFLELAVGPTYGPNQAAILELRVPADGGTTQATHFLLRPLPSGWTRCSIRADFGSDAGPGSVSVSVGGNPALTSDPLRSLVAAPPAVFVGVVSQDSAETKAHFDNVTFDIAGG